MTQPATREGATSTPHGVLTVADVLSRCRPATVDQEPVTSPVSVHSLLQREGRVPGAQRSDGTPVDDEPRRLSASALARRGAIAAGAVLAAGSVLGAAIVTSGPPVVPTGDAPLLEEGTPSPPSSDQRAPSPIPAITPTTGTLDAGAGVEQSWMNTAFPSATVETPPAADERSAPAASSDSDDVPAEAPEESDAPAVVADPTTDEATDDPEPAAVDQGAGDDDESDGERRGPVRTLLGGLVDALR